MLPTLRRSLSYANVMATVAVFVALGGTSVAAVSLARDSVGPAQIKKGAVRGSELGAGAVSSPKVRDGSLLARDFKSGQLPAGARGAQGPTGPVGATGATGTAGREGAPGVAGYEIRTSTVTIGAGALAGTTAICPDGKRVLGGGYTGEDGLAVTVSRPAAATMGGTADSAWRVSARNTTMGGLDLTAHAICATVR